MRERTIQDQDFSVAPDEPVFVIGVVSELVGLPIWTLRQLDRAGIVCARRRTGRARLYSLQDVRLLCRVRKLMLVQKVNLGGLRVILKLQARLDEQA